VLGFMLRVRVRVRVSVKVKIKVRVISSILPYCWSAGPVRRSAFNPWPDYPTAVVLFLSCGKNAQYVLGPNSTKITSYILTHLYYDALSMLFTVHQTYNYLSGLG